jgi:3-oxoacyl-[acyl-carrier protein] reductase
MDLGLAGRRVLVVAGQREIASACARAFVAEGAQVAVDATGARFSLEGAHQLDAALDEAPRTLAEEALAAMGGVDIVVAALQTSTLVKPLGATEDEALTESWSRLSSLAELYQLLIPSLKKGGAGRLIWVGPLGAKWLGEGVDGTDSVVGLGALGMHKTIAGELGQFGITANSVLWDPNRSPGEDVPRSVAATVTYLASENAAYVSGSVIAVDGGMFPGVF